MEKYNISKTSQSPINLKPHESELFESDNFGNTRLHVAAALGDLNAVRNLVTKDSSLMENKNKYGSTPLHYATWEGQLKSVEYLVGQG
ncbi:MAG: ankyrin repeat domain-containing protein, partial [Candidatus Rickettsiella isopodorum]